MDVTVVVPAFGALHERLAHERAVPSVPSGVAVVVATGATVADARQRGLEQVETQWVVHLDADDCLTPGYLDALAAAVGDIRVPAVEYHNEITGQYQRPMLWRKDTFSVRQFHQPPYPQSCLCAGNWVPIGAMAPADLLRKVGGWHDHAWSEDFCLWLRCHLEGASFTQVPAAVYSAHTLDGGRNQAPKSVRDASHREIAAENGIRSTR